MYNDLFSIGSIEIHGYGLMIGLGFLAAICLGMYRAAKRGLSEDHVFNIGIIALICGFLGAKILYVLTYIIEYKAFSWDIVKSEGFVVYGGIITGILSAMIYCRVKKLSFLSYFDVVMPSIAVNQGFGRIGCFLAGCCYGRETTSGIGVVFPEGSMAPSGISLLPTQLFSAGGDFLIAVILLFYARRAKHKGDTGALYLLLYGIGRFVIEYFRNDFRGEIGPFSTSQFISFFIVGAGIAIFAVNSKKGVPADHILPGKKQEENEETAE